MYCILQHISDWHVCSQSMQSAVSLASHILSQTMPIMHKGITSVIATGLHPSGHSRTTSMCSQQYISVTCSKHSGIGQLLMAHWMIANELQSIYLILKLLFTYKLFTHLNIYLPKTLQDIIIWFIIRCFLTFLLLWSSLCTQNVSITNFDY